MAIGDALPAARQVARRAAEPQRSKLPAPSPFADDMSGADYFRTDQHYRFIARAITRHLQEMRGFVLVTGEPPADGKAVELLLCDEKQKAILLTCLPDMSFADLVRAYGREVGLPIADGAKGVWSLMSHLMAEARRGVTHLLVLDKPDLLDDATLDEFFGLLKLDEPYLTPLVLLASPSFPARFEAPPLAAHAPLVIGRLSLQYLEREEVSDFIDRQLAGASDAQARLFTREIVETIAQAANGSPLVANRLARTVLISAAESEVEVTIPEVPAEIAPPPSEVTIPPFDRGDPLPSFLVPDRRAGNAQDGASPPPRSASSGAKRRVRSIGRKAGHVAGFAAILIAITAIPLTPMERAVDLSFPPSQDALPPTAVFAPLPPTETGTAPADAPPESSQSAIPPAEDPPPVPMPSSLAAATPAPSEPSAVSASAAAPTAPADEPPAERRGDDPSSPAPTIAPPPAPDHAARPPADIATMVRRGQELLAGGDILSARHFFELATPEAEDRAALGLGKSYDPLYLRRLGTRGPAGDAAKAAMWYRKAADLGSMEALALLQRLNASAAQ